MIWIFWILNFLFVVLPQRTVPLAAAFIGFTTYCLSYIGIFRRGRLCVTKNLKQAGISSFGLSSFVSAARCLVEFMTMFRLNSRNLNQWVELVGIDRLKAEREKDNGVIVLSGHLGNWELGAAALALIGYLTNVVSIRYMKKAVTDFFRKIRKKKGLKVIYIEKVRAMIRALRKGEILAMLGDRLYSGKGVNVQFFGRETVFPVGAFLLALRTQASIIPVFAVHEKGRLKVYFEKPIFVRNREDIMKGLNQYISILEKYIRRYPAEWHALSPIWED